MIARRQATKTCEDCGGTFKGGAYARFCPDCRPLRRQSKRRKYKLTEPIKRLLRERYDSRVRGRVQELAAEIDWPDWAVKKAASKLGLAHPWPKDRRKWTADEVAFLDRWAGLRGVDWLARKLGRGKTSVTLKLRRLRISRRAADGYSQTLAAECFGVDVHTLGAWIARGLLRLRESDGRIDGEEILRFVREHRSTYRLDKVDQEWFLGLLLDGDAAAVRNPLVSHTLPEESRNTPGATLKARMIACLESCGPLRPGQISQHLVVRRANVSGMLSRYRDIFEPLGGGLWQLRDVPHSARFSAGLMRRARLAVDRHGGKSALVAADLEIPVADAKKLIAEILGNTA